MDHHPSRSPSAEEIRSGYDRWSLVYDTDRNPLTALEEPVVRECVGDPAGLRVLDLGCGTGRHARWLADEGEIVAPGSFAHSAAELRATSQEAGLRCVVESEHAPTASFARAYPRAEKYVEQSMLLVMVFEIER